MPHHQDNSVADLAGRVRRWGRDARTARRARWGVAAVPPDGSEAPPAGTARTTVDATIRPVGEGRYRRLGWAPGEPHVVRTDLGASPAGDRAERRRSLLYVGHHTDVHVCDAQSPARLEGGETFGWFNPGADGGHRPQETCTTQVLDRLVAATNAVTTSPATGAPMAWCIHTGDNTDNRTHAELTWWLTVLSGGTVSPNTGAADRYEGVQRSGWRGAWHPDDPSGDVYGRAGFPWAPGMLDGAVAPFQAVGLEVPWLTVFGNHDLIYQGTFGPTVGAMGETLAGSGSKPLGAPGLVRSNLHARLAGPSAERWERWARGPGLQRVTPDGPARRSVPFDEYVRRLVADGDHGFTDEHVRTSTSWWSRSEGERVQVIGLDTCNHRIGSGGSLGPRQTGWLVDELERHRDRLVVVTSHHNSWTMDNLATDDFDPGPRTSGPELVALLCRHPNVVLWLNGHSHEHRVIAHPGPRPGTGLWEVDTASGIDFGQQARTFELLDNDDGTVSILVTVLDHAAPPAVDHRGQGGWTPDRLASLSRELAANDARWIDPMSLLGSVGDRNVELVVSDPLSGGGAGPSADR